MAIRLESSQQNAQLETDVVKAELAERVYQRLVAGGIFTDAAPKNRVLTDILNAIDLLAISLERAVDDSATISDAPSFELSRPLADTFDSADVLTKTIISTLADSISHQDIATFVLAKNIADTVSPTEALSWAIQVYMTDTAASSDTLSIQAMFHRSVSDTVTIGEIIGLNTPNHYGDTFGIQDFATITHVRGGSAILNSTQLNQSTLG